MRCLGCMAEYKDEYGLCPYCGYEPGTAAESSLHMQPGAILASRYLIGRVVGYGGFGVTYIGWDATLQQRVAIKEYLPSEFATRAVGQTQVTVFGGNKAEQFSGGMVKFVDEAKRLAQFQNEPGIVRVFDSFEANNTAYIVMEYLDGETLTSYLEREGKIPVEQAVNMLTPVIRSLEVVHKAGIIHRDIAPDNIILTKDGQVKLIDFGAARYATTSHSRSLTVIIKPGYSPEEQYRSRGDQGPHTDVYALAAVLYRMVTGVTPPDALERRAFYENKKKDILPPLSQNCKIEKNKENAILNAMNVRVEDRTKTANDFLNELTSETPVKRLAGKIKAVDLMKWPLWAKIAIPAGAAAVALLFALLLTGVISFSGNLVTDFTLGADMTRVPSVINCSVGVAQDKLEAQELVSVIGGREVSDTIPANMVLRQGIDAGGVVQKGSNVELYVSTSADAEVEDGIMPDVAFYSEEEARAMLEQLGAVVSTEEEYSADVAEGIVIRASVGYGEPLAEGDAVTLYISKGPDPSASSDSGNELTLNRSSLSLYVGDSVSLTASGSSGSLSWSSSNAGVAAVKNGTVTAVGRGSATITVSGGGKTASCTVTVQDYSISINESYLSLFVGDSSTLYVSGAPSGANINWSSSNSSVATVSSSGRVTAEGSGSATITASFSYGGQTYSESCSVRVREVSVSLSRSSLSMTVGESSTLSYTKTPSSGSGWGSASWSSSDTSVATVSSSGKVTAVSDGTATIRLTLSHSSGEKTATCYVTVEASDVEVSLSSSSLSMQVGDTEYLSASATPGEANLSWSSSDSSVVRVSNGRISAVGEGSAQITVTAKNGNKSDSASCYVTVVKGSSTLQIDYFSASGADGTVTASFSVSSNYYVRGGTITLQEIDRSVSYSPRNDSCNSCSGNFEIGFPSMESGVTYTLLLVANDETGASVSKTTTFTAP